MRLLVSIVSALVVASALTMTAPAVHAQSINWKTSCSVDAGSIKRSGKTWTFKTSKNRCVGGHYQQRAELSTAKSKLRRNTDRSYMFETNLSLVSSSDQKFDFFQIHDGRRGCAPPLKVAWTKNGQIELASDFKIGPKETDCIWNTSISDQKSKVRLKRDGTEYKINILLDFDGSGNFDVTVWVNNRQEVKGRYEYPKDSGYFESKFFYFKHGNYSEFMFDYILTSREMSVRRLARSS